MDLCMCAARHRPGRSTIAAVSIRRRSARGRAIDLACARAAAPRHRVASPAIGSSRMRWRAEHRSRPHRGPWPPAAPATARTCRGIARPTFPPRVPRRVAMARDDFRRRAMSGRGGFAPAGPHTGFSAKTTACFYRSESVVSLALSYRSLHPRYPLKTPYRVIYVRTFISQKMEPIPFKHRISSKPTRGLPGDAVYTSTLTPFIRSHRLIAGRPSAPPSRAIPATNVLLPSYVSECESRRTATFISNHHFLNTGDPRRSVLISAFAYRYRWRCPFT